MRLLQSLDILGKLAPVPRSLSSSCGVCARFQTEGSLEPFREAEIERLLRQEDKNYVLLIDKR